MAADCAHELKEDNVTMVSLWPGPVKQNILWNTFFLKIPKCENPQIQEWIPSLTQNR